VNAAAGACLASPSRICLRHPAAPGDGTGIWEESDMKSYATNEIRNLALVGSKGSGKTTLAEAMLFGAEMTTRQGRVEDGNTMFDFEPEEHKRVASVQSAVGYLEWKKNKVNILDTPGDQMFTFDANTCLAVTEGMLVVVSAPDGVEPHAVKMFKAGERHARAVVINKMGRERADFERALAEVKDRLSGSAVPVTLPIGQEESFKGVVDLLNMKAHIYVAGSQAGPELEEVPGDLQDAATEARNALLEEIAASDEALMDKYLESGELSEEEARDGLKAAIAAGSLVPVFAADGAHNIGTHEILNLVISSFPSPEGRAGMGAVDEEGNEVTIEPKTDGDLCALVFKTVSDQHSGKISIFRVLAGKATKDTAVENTTRDASERMGALIRLQGKKVEHVDDAAMGDIVAVAKLKDTQTGDTLVTGGGSVVASLPKMPPPQIGFRLIPKNKGDEDKISQAIARLREEDPGLVLGHDPITKEMMLSGFGIAHIDVALERMERKFGVQLEKAPPNVPYRETLRKGVENIEGKHKKQSGGRGQFGVCYINVKPRHRGDGYEFVNSIFGGAIPRQYIPAVDKGIQEAMERGVLAGYPVVDISVDLIDGKYHDVDSSEIAFKIAGSKGFQAAAKKAGIAILEPVMNVEVEVPEENMGDVMGDISSRRGKVLGMDTQDGVSTVKAQVPLAEMLTYAPDLKSMTSGRGSFTMVESHYDPVPHDITDKIIAASPNKPPATEEE
jgi:elongation factor G